jgi:hypothetical protein
MTAKEYLEPLRTLDREIHMMLVEMERLTDLTDRRQNIIDAYTRITASFANGRVQDDPERSRVEDCAVALAEAERADGSVQEGIRLRVSGLDAQIKRLLAYREEAQDMIGRIGKPHYRQVLQNRYINNLKWDTIADVMKYDVRWVLILHGRALQDFDRLLWENTPC